jgi:hypothetical protein
MTTERDPRTRTVLSWLREDVHENAERVLLRALDEVDATPQRRSWWPAWRPLQMNRIFMAAGAAVAVLVVAILAFNLLPRNSVGGPGVTPTAASTPSLAPSPTGLPILGSGYLAAGTYTAHPFPSPNATLEVTLTVPSGWQGFPPSAVTPQAGPGGPDGAAVAFLLVTELYSDPCKAKPGSATIPAGDTVEDLVRALGQVQSSYEVGTASDVTLGGYSGKRIDLVVPSDLDFTTCDSATYWIWDSPPYAQGPGNRWNIWILDVAGTRLVILGHDFPTTSPSDQAQLQDIVASVRIEP